MIRLLFSLLACWQLSVSGQSFSVLSYNCENAFDTIDTPRHADEAFLPDGEYHWTRFRFSRKINRIAQVILAADSLKPLDIAILQEVETDTVLTALLRRTPLASLGYEYAMTDSRDARGINVAIVYSPYTFHPISRQVIGLDSAYLAHKHLTPTRDILYLAGTLPTGDTLHVYALHLPSRLGGAEAATKRREILRRLSQHIDSLYTVHPQPRVLVAGDFNEGPTRQLKTLLPQLEGLMYGLPEGSYKYRANWEWIDQMWVSRPFFSVEKAYPRTLRLPPLLEEDASYGGTKPFRTYRGPTYLGGYSDHLPVVLHVNL